MVMADPALDFHALKRGDDVAWTNAFPRLWRVAVLAARRGWRTASHEELEDIAVNAISLAAAKIQELRDSSELEPLLVTIAYRKAISEYRRATVRPKPQPNSFH